MGTCTYLIAGKTLWRPQNRAINSRKLMTRPILDTVQWLLQFDKIKGHSAMCFDDNFIWLSKSLQQKRAALERTVSSVFAVG